MIAESIFSPLDEGKRRAARSIADQHDGIVLALVRERLPELPEDVHPHELRGRLEGFQFLPVGERPGYTEWVLDGRPLVRFWPAEVFWERGTVMHVEQRYAVLWPAA